MAGRLKVSIYLDMVNIVIQETNFEKYTRLNKFFFSTYY